MLKVLVVNGDRYLINEASLAVDDVANDIINSYPSNAVLDFDEVRMSDFERNV